MKPVRCAPALAWAALILSVCGPTPVGATGRVSLSWNGCSPIVSAIDSDGAHPYSAFVSVIGQVEPHKAYQCNVYLTTDGPTAPFPDAWRFDGPGCQTASRIRIENLPPATMAESCPAFMGSGNWIQINDVSFDPSFGRLQIVIAGTYPVGVTVVDPNVRYFLGRVEFDHTFSVVEAGTPGADAGGSALPCGGFERDMRLSLVASCGANPETCTPSIVRWLDLEGYVRDFEIENPTLTFCGSCGPTPAIRSTWGAIKGQYRR